MDGRGRDSAWAAVVASSWRSSGELRRRTSARVVLTVAVGLRALHCSGAAGDRPRAEPRRCSSFGHVTTARRDRLRPIRRRPSGRDRPLRADGRKTARGRAWSTLGSPARPRCCSPLARAGRQPAGRPGCRSAAPDLARVADRPALVEILRRRGQRHQRAKAYASSPSSTCSARAALLRRSTPRAPSRG